MPSEYKTSDGVVLIEEDGVYIRTDTADGTVSDNEIVMWSIDEIAEDPSVGLVIANAIALFFTKGADALAASIGKCVLPDGEVVLENKPSTGS